MSCNFGFLLIYRKIIQPIIFDLKCLLTKRTARYIILIAGIYNIVRHERYHTGEKPYVCTSALCNYKANKSCTLAQHMLTHTGAKPLPAQSLTTEVRTAQKACTPHCPHEDPQQPATKSRLAASIEPINLIKVKTSLNSMHEEMQTKTIKFRGIEQ